MSKLCTICYLVFIGFLLLLYPALVRCGEDDAAKATQPLSPPENIGFMTPNPKHLAEKFPMCDAFLKVDWIDKEKRIGYSRYEVIIDKTKERKMRWALIWLDQVQPRVFDAYQYKKSGKINDLFQLIRHGEISDDGGVIRVNDGKKSDRFFIYFNDTATLSGNNQMVCVPYPDQDRAWIIESRIINRLPEQIVNELSSHTEVPYHTRIMSQYFQSCQVIDINHDGIIDFYCGANWVVYSIHGKYYQNIITTTPIGNPIMSFPPSRIDYASYVKRVGHYLTTDGKDYFLSDLNVSKVTTQPAKEN